MMSCVHLPVVRRLALNVTQRRIAGFASYEKSLVKELGLKKPHQVCTLLKVLSEKDVAIAQLTHEHNLNIELQMHEKNLIQQELNFVTRKLLMAEGAMTARGMFNHTFEMFRIAALLRGGCSIMASLQHAEKLLKESSDTPLRRTKLHPQVSRVLDIIENADFPSSSLIPLYQRLSTQKHRRPWSGGCIHIAPDDFNAAEQRFLFALAEEYELLIIVDDQE